MSTPIMSINQWVSLPNEVRHRIRAIFSIPRSSNTVVNDGKIETDGTTYEDFKTLTIEKMQVFLSSAETDFHKLFDMVVAKVIDELYIEKNPIIVPEVIVKYDGRIDNVYTNENIVTKPLKSKPGRKPKIK